jgi:HAD superfamily hydrolase (TIGR01509 family)
MKLDHVGLEVLDLYSMELFYRKAFGFAPVYHYVSKSSPGLRTVFLEKEGVRLELLERPRDAAFLDRRDRIRDHLSLEVDDPDAAAARISALAWPGVVVKPARETGDGFREAEVRDPEGNVVELSRRVKPEPSYPVRAVIFDVDGTLLDSEENYFLADRQLLARWGIDYTPAEKRRYIGGGNREMMADIKARYGLRESVAELLELKNALYLEVATGNTRAYPEMARFAEALHALGVPLAVASGSSPRALETLLEGAGVARYFDLVLSTEQVARGKPSPDVFLEAARRLGVPPHECLVMEDSRYGVEAAKRAFMRCVAIPYLVDEPLDDAFSMADLLFEAGMPTFTAGKALAWVQDLLAPPPG